MARTTLKFLITDKSTHSEILSATEEKLSKYIGDPNTLISNNDYSLEVSEDPINSGKYTAEVYVRLRG